MSISKPKDLITHSYIQRVLDADSAAQAQNLTGSPTDLDKEARHLKMGMQLSKKALLRKLMIDSGDFLSFEPWERRKSILERQGFEQIFTSTHVDTNSATNNHFKYVVWIEKSHGLVFDQELVQLDPHHRHSKVPTEWWNFNSGHCYLCWWPANEDARVGLGNLDGGWESVKYPDWRSMYPAKGSKSLIFQPDDLYFRGYIVANSGLIHKLQSLLLRGQFMNVWPPIKKSDQHLSISLLPSWEQKVIDALPAADRVREFNARNDRRYQEVDGGLHSIMNVQLE